MRQDVELISEMVIFEHRLVQVGSGAAQGLPCLVWRGSGFAGFGVTLEQVAFCRQFGQVGEIRIESSTRVWQVWVLGARFVVSSGRSGRFV